MAELLIKAVDFIHPDPAKDAFAWKRGDVVLAVDDGHTWGSKESLPPDQGGKFVIIKVPQPIQALEAMGIFDAPRDGPIADPLATETGRRTHKMDLDSLPAADRAELATQGRLTLAQGKFAAIIKQKPPRAVR